LSWIPGAPGIEPSSECICVYAEEGPDGYAVNHSSLGQWIKVRHLAKFEFSAGPWFDSGPKTENSYPHGFELIDPQ